MTAPRRARPPAPPPSSPARSRPLAGGLLIGLLTALWAGLAGAQTSPSPEPAIHTLPAVQVSADPLAPDELRSTRPVTLLQSPALERSLDTTLGGTLAQQPGVHSSAFGAAAGRPVIRSQDGPRVRVTQDGLDTMDVSTLSPDHAIAADPLSAQRIEILRGPATLFYGGGAVGGLVNIRTERIPTERLQSLSGQALLSSDSAASGRSAAASVKAGAGGLNWTLGAFDRSAGDYRIPGQIVAGDPESRARRLPNSFARGDGFAGGVSYVGTQATVGVAHSTLANRYGIPSEADVFIDLKQRRTEALALVESPMAGIARVRASFADGHYRHDEIDGTGEVGTSLRSSGREARVEISHEPLAGVRGVLGVQSRDRSLLASGPEAYIPSSRDRNDALFDVGERSLGAARLEFGWRGENARLLPEETSGLGARRFSLNSLSLGLSLPVVAGYTVAANLSSSQRAPVIEELYAHGPHAATGTFEIGDPTLQRERSLNLDLGLRKTGGPVRWKIGVYANRFQNHVHGRSTDENGDGVADRVDRENRIVNSAIAPGAGEFTRLNYTQGRARFSGLEAELSWRLVGTPYSARVFGDSARGRIDGEGNVPRLAPTRIGGAVDFEQGAWSGFVSMLSVRGQQRVATLETTTPGYLRVDAELSCLLGSASARSATLFVQGRNLLNETIRPHTSYVKDIVPQPGRTLIAGVRARF